MRQVLIVLFIGLGLSGCSSGYINPGIYYFNKNTPETKSKRTSVVLDCRVKAASAVPSNVQISTKPGFLYNGTGYGSETTSVDINGGIRHQVFLKCLMDKGYSYNTARINGCRTKQVPTGYHNSESLIYEPKPNSCLVMGPAGHMGVDDTVVLRAEDQLAPN